MDDAYVKETCKPGTSECCAYLIHGADGWRCGKNSGVRFAIDLRLAEGTMRATGNNCDGWKMPSEDADDDEISG